MPTTEQRDAIIIGTGQSGKPLALALSKAGWKTVVIEREYVGGTCINFGCTPTKAMVASARVAYLTRRAADYGVHVGPVEVDMDKVYARKQRIVESFRNNGTAALRKNDNLELVFGVGRFIDTNTVEVDLNDGGTAAYSAPKIIIDTGGKPALPPIPGLIDAPVLCSDSILDLQTLPGHLLVLGGGYIGLEFGQMFRRYGSRVTIVQRGSHLVDREDEDVSSEVEKILRDDGVEVLLDTDAVRVGLIDDAEIELCLKTPQGDKKIFGTHLLAALGRTPNTDDLDLAAAGVATNDTGYISVNERLETNVPGIYATGDVKGGPAFTHISYDDFRVLRENFLNGGNATIAGRLVPNTVFIDPQLATVGFSETEARKQGRNVRIAKLPMKHVARAIETSETRGFMKAIVDADNDQILGATILGIEGGEIMSMLQIAMMGKLPYTQIKEAVFAHPTLAESLNNLFMTLDG